MQKLRLWDVTNLQTLPLSLAEAAVCFTSELLVS